MELEEGVFYQASYDGTVVPIVANYPGLLPASHVSNQETPSLKELPHYASPTALFRAPKGRRSTPQCAPEASPRRAAPTPSKSSKRKANDNMAEPSPKRYGLLLMPLAVTSNCDIIRCVFSGKAFARLCPGILPAAPPQVRFQTLP